MKRFLLSFCFSMTMAFGAVYDLADLPPINPVTDTEYPVTNSGHTYSFITTNANGNEICFPPEGALAASIEDFLTTPEENYYNTVVTKSNSFGAWVYFDNDDRGYDGGGVMAQRRFDDPVLKNFEFSVLADGRLEIRIARSNWATIKVQTTLPVPMDEWVYIQGYQSGNYYTVGWQTTDGTQSVATEYMYSAAGTDDAPQTYIFHIDNAKFATHVFWQPGVGMFTNMYDTDVSDAEIYAMGLVTLDITTQDFEDNLTSAVYSIGTVITERMLDIYIDDATDTRKVDLRKRACPSTLPPVL